MTELLEKINALISAPTRDLDTIERTLTDGYAHALSLEAEKWRLEKRINEVAQSLERGDTAKKARELAALANRIEGSAGDLVALRSVLAELRRHADAVRVANPAVR
jgi:predicted  nucleic acid-binding Zn-ribbon protein